MCLVSFVPTNKNLIITSSRDEDTNRAKPILVRNHLRNGKQLTFPRDVKGGTWIGYDNFRNFLVILNGAKIKHQRASSYRMSRGLIVLDLLAATDIPNAWKQINLTELEPFTLLHYSSDKKLWEWIWDGHKKITTQLDTKTGHCWLSSTLYTPEEWQQMRNTFIRQLPNLKMPEDLREFHLNNRYEEKTTGKVYPSVKTVSNTTVYFTKEGIDFNYLNVR